VSADDILDTIVDTIPLPVVPLQERHGVRLGT
jgi:hypothetical protein